MSLTVTQLFQLYAPLAGLLVVVFMMGGLFNKVTTLVDRVTKLERSAADGVQDAVHLGRLEERIDNMGKTVDKVDREMQGVLRMLANMTSGRRAQDITKFDQSDA